MGQTETLAKFVIETPSSAIPAEAREAAKISLMDAVGTALTGNTQPVGKIITEFVQKTGGAGESHVIGTRIKTSGPQAALANGTLGHADDYDDVNHAASLHPAVALMPPALAVGEMLGRSGAEALDAYVIGYEFTSRIKLGANHYARGWHATATVGTMAATAVASRLMGLSVEQTRNAFGIAASQTSGLIGNFGTMTKPLHAGHASRAGVTAAMLAHMGFTANPDIFEAHQGYGAVFGDPAPDLNALTDGLGGAWRIMDLAAIKEWPCCYGNHAAIPMALRVVRKHEFRADDVAEVLLIQPFPGGARYLNRPIVKTGLNGKFSLQFNVAAALVDRRVSYDTFTDGSVARPEVQAMIRKVRLLTADRAVHEGPTAGRGAHGPISELVVYLKDGRRLSDAEDGTTNTLRGSRVDEKYRENAARVLPPERVTESNALLRGFENASNVADVMKTVTLG